MKLETFHNSDEPVIYAYYVSVENDAEVFLDEWDAKDWAIENSNGEDYKIIPLYKIAEPADEPNA
jgi:uncharacterized protein affecting Mg2+/Co2+ transport